jgi:hypothetical protein
VLRFNILLEKITPTRRQHLRLNVWARRVFAAGIAFPFEMRP